MVVEQNGLEEMVTKPYMKDGAIPPFHVGYEGSESNQPFLSNTLQYFGGRVNNLCRLFQLLISKHIGISVIMLLNLCRQQHEEAVCDVIRTDERGRRQPLSSPACTLTIRQHSRHDRSSHWPFRTFNMEAFRKDQEGAARTPRAIPSCSHLLGCPPHLTVHWHAF